MIPDRKLRMLFHNVLNCLLFIVTNISYPSRSLSHFTIWHDNTCWWINYLGNFKKWIHWKKNWKQTRFEIHLINVILIWNSFCIEAVIWLSGFSRLQERALSHQKTTWATVSVAFCFLQKDHPEDHYLVLHFTFLVLGDNSESSFTHGAQFPFVNFWCSRSSSSG